MKTTRPPTITMIPVPKQSKRLATLLQRGFLIPCTDPIPLETMLLGLPGFTREYIHSRIETIFINGTAADSLAQPVPPGCTVALSAAMPGLAGAIFRKKGMHAILRTPPPAPQADDQNRHQFLTLKLFNMVADDCVQPLLDRGIMMKNTTLARFFKNRAEQLPHILSALTINRTPVPMDRPVQLPANQEIFLVRAKTDPADT